MSGLIANSIFERQLQRLETELCNQSITLQVAAVIRQRNSHHSRRSTTSKTGQLAFNYF